MARARLRDLGIEIGRFPPGPYNAISDVHGVRVGHQTIIRDSPRVARTGVTIIQPRGGQIGHNYAFSGVSALNGNGELTGAHWISETGLLTTPIGLTNTYEVGIVRDAIIEYALQNGYPQTDSSELPVVAETYDGWLNDIGAFHLTKEDVFQALDRAAGGPIEEGNVGGGTGMICHEFKGGIGTASRLVQTPASPYTLGALVQANYGDRLLLRIDGVPVGRMIGTEAPALPWVELPTSSSIIVVIATNAPLVPIQCQRLARRATIGLARAGGYGANSSGDIFLAFATGNPIPCKPKEAIPIQMLPNEQMSPLFEAAAEAVEEAILNALVAAETMTGYKQRTAYALPLERVAEIFQTRG